MSATSTPMIVAPSAPTAIHVAYCVEHAIASGDKADQRRKIAELMAVVGRAER